MRVIDPVKLTQKLVNFNTSAKNEKECAEFTGALLRDYGFEVEYHDLSPGRTNIIASLKAGRGQKPLCFSGHIDVVPYGNASWGRNPVSGEIHGDKLYGRGASDMKSGLAAMISAAVSVAGDKRPKKAGLKLVITAAEEESCQGACFLNKQGVLGKAGALIICEPTSNFPFAGHKGSLWLKVKINGRSAHGSMPEKGDNAIYKAAETILKLKDFTFPEPDENKAWRTTLNVGKIFGGVSYNLVPDFSEFLIDIRTAPGTDHGGIIQSIRNILPEDSELTVTSDQPGFASARCPWIDEIFKSASEVLGALPEPDIITYFTDAPALLAAFGNPPAVIWGPGEASQAHQTDEYCYVHRIREATRMYRKAAEKWCFGGSV